MEPTQSWHRALSIGVGYAPRPSVRKIILQIDVDRSTMIRTGSTMVTIIHPTRTEQAFERSRSCLLIALVCDEGGGVVSTSLWVHAVMLA